MLAGLTKIEATQDVAVFINQSVAKKRSLPTDPQIPYDYAQGKFRRNDNARQGWGLYKRTTPPTGGGAKHKDNPATGGGANHYLSLPPQFPSR